MPRVRQQARINAGVVDNSNLKIFNEDKNKFEKPKKNKPKRKTVRKSKPKRKSRKSARKSKPKRKSRKSRKSKKSRKTRKSRKSKPKRKSRKSRKSVKKSKSLKNKKGKYDKYIGKVVFVKYKNNQYGRFRWIVKKRDDGRYIVRAPKIGVLVRDLDLLRDKDYNKETLLPKDAIIN